MTTEKPLSEKGYIRPIDNGLVKKRMFLERDVAEAVEKLKDTIKNSSVSAFRVNDRVRVIRFINKIFGKFEEDLK